MNTVSVETTRVGTMLYVGTSGYAYPAWKGKFYPQKFPADQMLRFYSERFQAVEINSTFYKLPTAETVKAWAAEVPVNFKFPLKAPQRITHIRRLKNAAADVKELFDLAGVLKKRVGPVLFGLPPNFKKDLPRLKDFLKLIPKRNKIAFEFRHQSWFDEEVFTLLRKHKVALCIADDDNDLEVPFVATAGWGYLRLRRPNYSPAKLKAWVKQVQEQDWTDTYVFFKHEDEAHGPVLAVKFLKLANKNLQ